LGCTVAVAQWSNKNRVDCWRESTRILLRRRARWCYFQPAAFSQAFISSGWFFPQLLIDVVFDVVLFVIHAVRERL
jgi:hypothetical protein